MMEREIRKLKALGLVAIVWVLFAWRSGFEIDSVGLRCVFRVSRAMS